MKTNINPQSLKAKNKGFSLMELLFVIGIIAALIATAIALYSGYKKKSNIKDVVAATVIIQGCVGERYANWRDYSGLDNPSLLTGACIPATLKTNVAGQIRNPWSATGVVVAAASANTVYDITQNTIPDEECVDIAMALNPEVLDFESLRINGTAVTTPAQISSACAAGNNAITWRVR